jgi:hypothetical protein
MNMVRRDRHEPAAADWLPAGPKPRRSAKALHDMLHARLQALDDGGAAATSPVVSAVELGLPYAHPADALGRTWNVAELKGLRSTCIAPARLLIDNLREAYDIEGH